MANKQSGIGFRPSGKSGLMGLHEGFIIASVEDKTTSNGISLVTC